MPLPRWVALFNKRFTNRFIEPVVRRSTGFAVIEHRGRRSGTLYRTPVNVFDVDKGRVLVALTYGPEADWVQNVLNSGGEMERGGSQREISSVQMVGRTEAWPHVPLAVRIALRVLTVHHFCLMSVTDLK